MKEKGQIWIGIAGLLFLVVVFFAGWFANQKWGPSTNMQKKNDKISVLFGQDKYGKSELTKIVMNNCESDAESVAHESRELTYQHIFDINSDKNIELEIIDVITTQLSKNYGLSIGETFKINRNFDFHSVPHKITIHTIEFKHKLRTGVATVNGKNYDFTYLEDVEVSTSSIQQACP